MYNIMCIHIHANTYIHAYIYDIYIYKTTKIYILVVSKVDIFN